MMALLMTAVTGVILVFLVGSIFEQRINHQQYRNTLIKQEISRLEVRIARIDELERTRARLISRKQVIEQLQASRSITVELLDQLAKTIPVGVTLTSIRQQGPQLALIGNSQSNARVSAYLRELEGNDLFLDPQLNFVRSSARPATDVEPYEFSIGVRLRQPKTEDEEFGNDVPAGQGGSQ
jgi:type IV pilus assembly protein PilN